MADRTFVDISNYTSRFQAAKYAKAGPMLVAVLATDGQSFVSSRHAEQADHAHEAGLDVWHYHFYRPGIEVDVVAQAIHFWKAVHAHFHPGDRLVLDMELRPVVGDMSLVASTHKLDEVLYGLSGQHAVGYTFDSLLREVGSDWQVKSGEWWIAKPDGILWPLGAGRRAIARQIRLDGVGKGIEHVPGVEGFDVDRLAFWYARRLDADRRRRRQSVK